MVSVHLPGVMASKVLFAKLWSWPRGNAKQALGISVIPKIRV